MALLEIRNLSVQFQTHSGPFRAVDGIDLDLDKGELLGVVGESGSGKSVTMLAVMGLIPWPGRVTADRMMFDGIDLMALKPAARRKIVGKDIAMIFQEPMTSLNPCFTVGYQIMETLQVHEGGSRRERRDRTVELLEQVGIPAASTRLDSFPHQLSAACQQAHQKDHIEQGECYRHGADPEEVDGNACDGRANQAAHTPHGGDCGCARDQVRAGEAVTQRRERHHIDTEGRRREQHHDGPHQPVRDDHEQAQ